MAPKRKRKGAAMRKKQTGGIQKKQSGGPNSNRFGATPGPAIRKSPTSKPSSKLHGGSGENADIHTAVESLGDQPDPDTRMMDAPATATGTAGASHDKQPDPDTQMKDAPATGTGTGTAGESHDTQHDAPTDDAAATGPGQPSDVQEDEEDPSFGAPPLVPATGRSQTASSARIQNGSVLKQWPSGIKRVSARGLHNEDNWCYRVSPYQGLLHCPEVVNFLNSCSEQCQAGPDNCSICALRRLSFAYWAKGKFVNTKMKLLNNGLSQELTANYGKEAWDSTGSQQDAAEFLRCLIKVLARDSGFHEGAQLLNRALFESTLERARRCRACGTRTLSSDEPQDVWTLGSGAKLHETVTLDSCLSSVFDGQLEEACANDKCAEEAAEHGSNEQGVIFEKRIKTAQEVLMLIMPVQIPPKAGEKHGTKRTKRFSYPEHLNLSRYTQHKTKLNYTLRAVIAHLGKTVNAGHYITAVREPDKSVSTASDSDVYRCTRSSVAVQRLLEPVSPGAPKDGNVQAYILMYTKHTG